jgi:2-keto-4-pentenoate hydratase/2-oxohepta-3-ene-1,7-dioic acid hydratase in catechol pathway
MMGMIQIFLVRRVPMKFVRFRYKDKTCFGVWEGDFVHEISGSIFGDFQVENEKYPFQEVRLLKPVEPSKVLCVGLNFREHIAELGDSTPQFPSHFLKSPTSLIGPEDPIIYPRVARRVDYEGELAAVIKLKAKDVSEAEALKYILGYTCFNDVTERELTRVQGQLIRSKGFDTFGPFGPCIATDLDPTKLTVQTYLNGNKVQEGYTGNLVFSVAFLVHYLSQCMTLFPGDVISIGTPGGIGPMKVGDIVEVRIEGIGTLKNPIARAV